MQLWTPRFPIATNGAKLGRGSSRACPLDLKAEVQHCLATLPSVRCGAVYCFTTSPDVRTARSSRGSGTAARYRPAVWKAVRRFSTCAATLSSAARRYKRWAQSNAAKRTVVGARLWPGLPVRNAGRQLPLSNLMTAPKDRSRNSPRTHRPGHQPTVATGSFLASRLVDPAQEKPQGGPAASPKVCRSLHSRRARRCARLVSGACSIPPTTRNYRGSGVRAMRPARRSAASVFLICGTPALP